MRLSRLACALFSVAVLSSAAHADVLRLALQAAQAQPGGAPPPKQQPGDLTAWAGEPRAITLPELLQTAVQQTPALQSAKLDIAIAEARIQQTWGRHDWLVQAGLEYRRDPGTLVSGQSDSITGSIGVTRLFPTGGTASLRAGSGWSRSEDVVRTIMGVPVVIAEGGSGWGSNAELEINQPLLRGFGRDLFDAGERQAVLARDAAVLARQLAAIQTIQAVISAYWDLVLAERGVAITQASLDLARERLRVTQIGADGGKIPRSEIPAVLQIIATREEDVLNGELGVLDRSIALRRAAGLPIGAGELGLRVATDLGPQDRPLELGPLVERAFAASPELAQFAKQDASAAIEIEVAENGLLPRLDAALRLGTAGSGRTFGGAWENLAEFDGVTVLGSLTFEQSIGQSEVRGRIRESRETRRKLMVTATDVRSQLAQTMTRSVAQVELARRRVTLSQRAIDLANENIKIETDRFNLGKSTNFDVLNRQEDLRQAELRKTQALIDWHKAELVVLALTGDLLPTYGITVN